MITIHNSVYAILLSADVTQVNIAYTQTVIGKFK